MLEQPLGFTGLLSGDQDKARKIDVISYNCVEQPTGIDLVNRLRQAGYTTERTDPTDKRAKLVQPTDSGKQLLFALYERLSYPAYLLVDDVSSADKPFILNRLGPVKVKHGKILTEGRQKRFTELFTDVLGPAKLSDLTTYQRHQITRFTADKG